MKLYIQNMVCLCCKMTVAEVLHRMDLPYANLELGQVDLTKPITLIQRTQLKETLNGYGLKIMEDKKVILVEKIVAIIVKMIHEVEELPAINFSVFLSDQLHQEYHYLSTLFSKTKGITIEQFIILHKVERVKELIMDGELSLTEISYKLQYSSMAHLSNQFKKVTGVTPSFFKNIKSRKRTSLENVRYTASAELCKSAI